MLRNARAISWVLWRRHRWGLSAVIAYVTLLAIGLRGGVLLRLLEQAFPGADPREIAASSAVVATIPFWIILTYLVSVFAYGFETDLSGRESGFPRHLLTLPVRTFELAGVPMLLGAATLGLGWFAVRWAVVEGGGLQAPWVWPALLAVVLMIWVQALSWTPFPLPWMRAIVGAAALSVPIVVVAAGLTELQLSDAAVSGILALFVPVGMLAAYRGVARERRGDVPDWQRLTALMTALGTALGRALSGLAPQRRRAFASPQGAQVWFEWRRHGITLPVMVAIILPLMLLPLALGRNDVLPTARTLLPILFLPALLAGSAAATVGKHSGWVRDYYGVPAFTATRPLTTLALVAAKFKMALVSTAITWTLLLTVTGLAVLASHAREDVAGWWRTLAQERGPLAAVAAVAAALSLLVMLTWKRLVENMVIGLTGREWIIKGSIFVGMFVYFGLAMMATWVYLERSFYEMVVAAFPWVLGGAVLLKAGLAIWAVRALHDLRLIDARLLAALLTGWVVVAGALVALLCWLVPSEMVAWEYLAVGVVLVLPLVRPMAAPLALAWNRHR
jgi:hypothetical protein